MIAYWLRGSSLPKSCIKVINKLCSRFLFSRDIAVKKLHLIAWKDTCIPKINGGLGIPSLDSLSFGISCTIIWRFLNGSNPLFHWWRNRYKSLWAPLPNRSSSFWINLSKVAKTTQNCFQLRVHSNCHLSLLWDPWCFGTAIRSFWNDTMDNCLLDSLNNMMVSDIICNGNWLVPANWPSLLQNKTKSVPLWNCITGSLWNNVEKVSNKLFLKEFFKTYHIVNWHNLIWHKRSAIKFSSYGWLAVKKGLKTADLLLKRGIMVNSNCVLCQDGLESHSHLFFECDFSFRIINSLIPQTQTLLLRPNLLQAFDLTKEIADNRRMKALFCLILNSAIYFICAPVMIEFLATFLSATPLWLEKLRELVGRNC